MNSETDLIIFGLNIYQEDNLLRKPHLQNEFIKIDGSLMEYWKLRKINLGPCNKLYRRDKIHKYFDTTLSLGEDTKFVIEYMNNVNTVRVVEECLYNVSLDNSESLNRKYQDNRLEQLIVARDCERDFLKKKYGYVSPLLYNEYFFNLYGVLFEIVNRRLPVGLVKKNIEKMEYKKIYKKCNFGRNYYYKIFAYFVVHNQSRMIYYMIKIRQKLLHIQEIHKMSET